MPSPSRLHPLAFLLVGLALLAGAASVVQRCIVEQRNRTVELVLDMGELRLLSAAAGKPVDQALRVFQEAGIRGVAITETLVQDLLADGRLRPTVTLAGVTGTTLATDDSLLLERIRQAFAQQTPLAPAEGAGQGVSFVGPGGAFLVPNVRVEEILRVPLGLDAGELRMVKDAGLDPVARIYNYLGSTPATIRSRLQTLHDGGVKTVIFAEEEVLGFQGQLPDTADALEALGLNYGSVEFGKQRGDEGLSERVEPRLLRVHSISPAEIKALSVGEAIDRYVRAVDERNIRVCYVRLTGSASQNTYLDTRDYVGRIAAQLHGSGFAMGLPQPLTQVWDHPRVERFAMAVLGAGVGASGLLLLGTLFPLDRRRQFWLTLLFAAIGTTLMLAGREKGRQVVALGAALVFPALAFLWVPQPVGAFAGEGGKPVRSPIGWALVQFAVMCLLSGAGAFLVAAALTDRSYMLKIESFAGIKIAHVGPVLVVGLFYLLGLTNRGTWAGERDTIVRRARAAWEQPVRVGHVVGFMIGAAALALLLLRTGNDPGVGVSATEMKFRALLEAHLVRPRTKEFLIGHPALVLGLAMAAMPRWRGWSLPLLLIGAIGQVSIVNSFCHIHTPFLTSLARTFNGVWLGAIIGAIPAAVLAWLQPRGHNHRANGAGRP